MAVDRQISMLICCLVDVTQALIILEQVGVNVLLYIYIFIFILEN